MSRIIGNRQNAYAQCFAVQLMESGVEELHCFTLKHQKIIMEMLKNAPCWMMFNKVNPLSLTDVPGSKRFTMKTEPLANKVEAQRVKLRVMVKFCEGGSLADDIQEVLDEVMASCDKALELQLQFEEALTGSERGQEAT
ncbi:hypothetical protein T10_10840 [Trichinella papuae]|uniref:Uncharacterized protein n=1 Tax=Trichinella papuae TaxID=268474 RepID=A0A0V1MFZ5_9BILA|nr:hypothetical protein T10_10840 [Trichinella papuae]